jgi:hypothetical protein
VEHGWQEHQVVIMDLDEIPVGPVRRNRIAIVDRPRNTLSNHLSEREGSWADSAGVAITSNLRFEELTL